MAAFFVTSECLANAVKHAAATKVVISVQQAGYDIVITVTDDGYGGAVVTDGGGLRGLRDRVEALDGTLEVCSAAQHGTTVTARLPARR
jgi:signal transduction histidine kinase